MRRVEEINVRGGLRGVGAYGLPDLSCGTDLACWRGKLAGMTVDQANKWCDANAGPLASTCKSEAAKLTNQYVGGSTPQTSNGPAAGSGSFLYNDPNNSRPNFHNDGTPCSWFSGNQGSCQKGMRPGEPWQTMNPAEDIDPNVVAIYAEHQTAASARGMRGLGDVVVWANPTTLDTVCSKVYSQGGFKPGSVCSAYAPFSYVLTNMMKTSKPGDESFSLSTGMGLGAKIGIGVGVTSVVGAVAYFLLRRRLGGII